MGTCGVGSRCAVSECGKYGSQAPPPQKTGGSVDVDPCNVSKKYGPNVTGTYTIVYKDPYGAERRTVVTCAHSQCTPRNPNNKNACYDICGKYTCGRDY